MAVELALTPLRAPREAWRTLRRLRAFRRIREELREFGRPAEALEELQYREPARRLGETPQAIAAVVAEWIFSRPLRHLGSCRREGIEELLSELRARSVRLGVFSDYPAAQKLEALGLAEFFPLVLCATDPEINAFKPHPRGFQRACESWELEPAQVLYVGDRADVDGRGARAAGMDALILGRKSEDYPSAETIDEVRSAVLG